MYSSKEWNISELYKTDISHQRQWHDVMNLSQFNCDQSQMTHKHASPLFLHTNKHSPTKKLRLWTTAGLSSQCDTIHTHRWFCPAAQVQTHFNDPQYHDTQHRSTQQTHSNRTQWTAIRPNDYSHSVNRTQRSQPGITISHMSCLVY